MAEWQPIETAPTDGTRILATRINSWVRDNGIPQVDILYWTKYADGGGDWWAVNYEELDEHTHWMPLPEPPKAEEL